MKTAILGNVAKCDDILGELRQLQESKTLDDQQARLVQILRYPPHNWCFRVATLKVIRQVNHPTDELLKGILDLALNENVYVKARAVAVDVLADLMVKDRRIHSNKEMTTRSGILQKLEYLMAKSDSSMLRESIEAFFQKFADRKCGRPSVA